MDNTGPHLQAALICERVLQEQDQVPSVIRIIDRIFFALGPDGELVQPQHPIFFFISFKAGSARGSFNVEIHREKPSGERALVLNAPVFFEGEERGVNVVVGTAFAPDQAGLYWFDVMFEGTLVTRIPLRAVFQPQPTVGSE